MARKREVEQLPASEWTTVEHPGFSGKYKDERVAIWNRKFGEDGWRLAWELANGEVWNYDQVFWMVFVPGYVRHFMVNPSEAVFLTQNYSHVYDRDQITRAEAFDPHALYMKSGVNNQIHHAALNIALEWYLGMPFQGRRSIQVREEKPGTATDKQPEGYLWSPGRIAAVRPELIPDIVLPEIWWQKGTIEDLYQTTKVLQTKNPK